MRRKDYKIIAKALCLAKPDCEVIRDIPRWRICCASIAKSLKEENANFDKRKFFRTCEGDF